MFEKVLGRGLRLSQCRLDGHRSCDFEAKPARPIPPAGVAGQARTQEPTTGDPETCLILGRPPSLTSDRTDSRQGETDEQGPADRQPARRASTARRSSRGSTSRSARAKSTP